MRAKGNALFGDFAQIAEAEYLKSTGIGENRTIPGHKLLHAAEVSQPLDARAQVQVIGVIQQNLDTQLFQGVLRNAFDRAYSSHRHEDRGLHLAVGRKEASRSGAPISGLDLEAEGHLAIGPSVLALDQARLAYRRSAVLW